MMKRIMSLKRIRPSSYQTLLHRSRTPLSSNVSTSFIHHREHPFTRNLSSNTRPDPFARRPNKKCDPYGQEGKPLSNEDASRLLTTVDKDWEIQYQQDSNVPFSIQREFQHSDFIQASQFLTSLAAVAQLNDHYPTFRLERRMDKKHKVWKVYTTVECRTFVLQGLSHHDFFIATVCRSVVGDTLYLIQRISFSLHHHRHQHLTLSCAP